MYVDFQVQIIINFNQGAVLFYFSTNLSWEIKYFNRQ